MTGHIFNYIARWEYLPLSVRIHPFTRTHKQIQPEGNHIISWNLTLGYTAHQNWSKFYPLARTNKALYAVLDPHDPYNRFRRFMRIYKKTDNFPMGPISLTGPGGPQMYVGSHRIPLYSGFASWLSAATTVLNLLANGQDWGWGMRGWLGYCLRGYRHPHLAQRKSSLSSPASSSDPPRIRRA